MSRAPLTLIVETLAGSLVRTIPDASPLRTDVGKGQAAEVATHDAAAVWGLPDFVFRAEVIAIGSGRREIGDAVLRVGDLGVVVQVKCRATPTGNEVRERAWLDKSVTKGLRQAHGTIRKLKSGPVRLTNARDRAIDIDGTAVQWMAVIVVDHPDVPDSVTPAMALAANPAVVMIRREWEFLWEQLKWTYAVCGYLKRVADEPHELGHEPSRYYQLALADEQASPKPIKPALLMAGARQLNRPLLPMQPVASDNRNAHLLVRVIFEDIATSPMSGRTEEDRIRVLAELDRLPVVERGDIGAFLVNGLAAVVKTPVGTTEWRIRRVVGELNSDRSANLAYGACNVLDEMHKDIFRSWVELRHHDMQAIVDNPTSLTTIGVLLTPRRDGVRPWDTTMMAVAGDLGLTDEELALYRDVWSHPDQEDQ